MTVKKLNIQSQNTDIYIGESYKNLINYLPDKKTVLVCDENIYSAYSEFIDSYPHIIIPAGEQIKKWSTVEYIILKFMELGIDRNSFAIAMGGGVVCDILGFAASVYMRGVEFGFVPSSLLAQVDASIGGKNGFNIGVYKNIVGSFNAPKFILVDNELLNTLPELEFNSGMAELIKHGMVYDKSIIEFLQQNHKEIMNNNRELMIQLLIKTIEVKVDVVNKDPKESSLRKILNFGHSLGHAIEIESNFTHGQAVAVGMVFAANLSRHYKSFPDEDYEKLISILRLFNLPVNHNVEPQKIIEIISMDKKKDKDIINFILLERIGKAVIKSLKIEELASIIKNIS
ncbi:MAG: 3-dehydroquinate synthase [Marinifilaceae bacterium]|jgi:3-dehydroquinate synthase|nr:3-dehydroquinate synthase [Marinifilaceae bacterium]